MIGPLLEHIPPLLGGTPFLRDDARAAGLQPERLPALVASGVLRQPLRGVYLDNRIPDDLASRAACVKLKLPRDAAVVRGTAAWLGGVDARGPGQRDEPLVVECAVPLGCQPLRRPGVRCYVAPLDGDIQFVDGVPTTTHRRTVVDLLRWLAPHMGLAVADAMAGKGLVDPAEIVLDVERFAGRPGVQQARYLAALIEPRCESFGESWLRLRVVDAGFPRPRVQIELVDAHGFCKYRLDLGWDDVRVAVEYDGEEFHSTPEQRRHDALRSDDIERSFGWRLIGVGKGEVLGPSMRLEAAIGELLSMSPRSWRRRW